jgi:Host cell surface-exposed lipoprotein
VRSLVCLVGAVSGLALVAQAAAELPVLTSVGHVQRHPQATPQPRYEASVRSIHPGAIRDRSRNWTYRGDTVRVAFRNATARPSNSQLYRVCYDFSAFSRKGLIEQLSSEYGEGFSKADAIYAVNHLDVDWNDQAAKSAKNYLDQSASSRQGLIGQLSSE